MKHEYITEEEDHVAQRHERIGTENIYEYLEEKDIPVRVHTHDRNMSINRLVKDKSHDESSVVNQNDTWHTLRTLRKLVKAVASGPKYKAGSTWHQELEDNIEPIVTYATWPIKNCEKEAEKLRSSILNVVAHYQGEHKACSSTSRCRCDP